MPNMIATIVLVTWPVVALGLYMFLPAGRASIWTILGGYLLLPVAPTFDIPGLPDLDKTIIPNLAAICLAPIMARSGDFRWPRSNALNLLMLLFVLCPFATIFTNGEPIKIGTLIQPGLGFKEGISAAVGNALQIVPFVLGAALLGNERGHRDLLRCFVIAALVYSLPMLEEIRLSPFLQGKIYSITSTNYFLQQMRCGGFSSLVFLGHCLMVSTFCAMALVATIGLWRARERLFTLPMALIAFYLTIVLILNKTLGAVVLVALITPLFVFMKQRRFLLLAAVMASMVVIYPLLRGADMVPLKGLNQMAAAVSQERAASFQYRVNNETLLLNRAEMKPWFGWGTYGRNRVIVATDWGSVEDVAVTDGTWIIAVGMFGWTGYIAMFGLLAYPFWRAVRLRKHNISVITGALLAMHLLNLLDLIPNSSLKPPTWLVAGALAGMTAASLRSGARTGRAPIPRDRQVPAEPLPQA